MFPKFNEAHKARVVFRQRFPPKTGALFPKINEAHEARVGAAHVFGGMFNGHIEELPPVPVTESVEAMHVVENNLMPSAAAQLLF